MPVPVAGTVAVEVAWTSVLAGVITVGTYQVGSADVVGGDFGLNVFDDISADVLAVEIERGRSEPFGPMSMGWARVTLKDDDATYDPENTASSLYGYLKPFRPIRVQETYSGTAYGHFYGYIEEIWHDPLAYRSYIKAVDFFERLAGAKITIGAMGATNVGAAIGEILDERGWPQASWRALDDGHSIPDFSADGTKDGGTLISDLLAMDRGTFFVDGDGLTTYHSLDRRYKRQAAVATWTAAQVSAATPGTSIRRVVNSQSVTRTGGAAQSWSDTDSEHEYDTRDGTAITSAYLNTDAQALDLATWIVVSQKDPRPPAREITMINADEARLLQILQREIGDYVMTVVDKQGSTMSGWIERLRLEIGPDKLRRARYTVAKQTSWFWTVGQSQVGGVDLVGY